MSDRSHDVTPDRSSGDESIGRREFLTPMMAASLSATSGFAQTVEDTRAAPGSEFSGDDPAPARSGFPAHEQIALRQWPKVFSG